MEVTEMLYPLYAYTTIARPFDEVAAVLAGDPASAFVTTLRPSQRVALVELEGRVAGVDLARHVVIELGEPSPRGAHELVVPLSWHAAERAAAFPRATAVLEIVALSNHPPRTQVTIVGSYDVPLGFLGAAVDRLAGERVAKESVERLVAHVAGRLGARVAAGAAPAPT